MCQAALRYARRGWPVFPCRERDETRVIGGAGGKERTFTAKAPYGGSGLKDATTDEARITAWWRQHPDAMIGLPAGVNGCFVLDFDPRVEEMVDDETGEVTRREWTLEQLKADLETQMGCALPRSLALRTPSGGVHVFFRQPDGEPIRNRGNLPSHVDVRGLGGYTVGPPSRILQSASGSVGEYRWMDRGDWRDDAAVVEAPAALIDILRSRKPKQLDRPAGGEAGPSDDAPSSRSGPPSHRLAATADDAVRKYALAGLDAECRAIRSAGSGARNGQLNESAFKVATLVAAGALDAGVARASIEAAARDNPGRDDAGQLAATIDSGWTAGLAQPRDLAEVAASSRSRADRRERGPPAGSRPRTPAADAHGQPSSRRGGSGDDVEDGEALERECALLPHTDLGNLERFLKRHGRDFLYVEAWGWLAWDGQRWNRDMAVPLLGRAVQSTMRAIQAEAALVRDSGIPEPPMALFDAEQRRAHGAQQRGKLDRIVKVTRGDTVLLSDTIAKWGRTSEGAGHIACIAKLAEARLARRPDDFDADPLLLNVENGTLAFARGERGGEASVTLRPFDRADRITKIAAVAYRADARSPLFDGFLAEVQPEAEMRAFLDCWAGYNALGLADAQKMALFYGQGSNGKGVWINTVAGLLGDYAWAAAIETFIDQGRYRKGSDASPDLAALAGRRMVYANEPEDNSKFSDGLIKAMTSDEPIGGVRELMKPPFQLLVTFTNTISANNRPKIGTDHGIQRRMQVVPWDVIIPDARQDVQLKSKLKAEASGILNRIVRGALQYLTSGLPAPEAVKAATREYQEENDILGQFLALCIAPAPGTTLGASALHALFAAWQTWAQLLPATGKPWSAKHLNAQMQRKGYTIRKSSSMVWNDIWARYEPYHFVDHENRPVTDDLPAPTDPPGASSAPDARPFDDDMPP